MSTEQPLDVNLRTKEQVAEQLQISVRTLDRMITKGEIHAFMLTGKRSVRLDQRDVMAFIEKKRKL